MFEKQVDNKKYYGTCSKSVFTFLFGDDNEYVDGG
jgi:hypothetical protein